MIIIHPNGKVEQRPYVSYRSIGEGVNLPGKDDPFTMVPVPERDACGYSVFANDVGLLIGLDPNPWAEKLCDYSPLVGPIVVTTFEEAKEEDLIGCIEADARASFIVRLEQVIEEAEAFYARNTN